MATSLVITLYIATTHDRTAHLLMIIADEKNRSVSGTVKVSADHFRVMIFSLVSVATKVFAMSAREQLGPYAGSPPCFLHMVFLQVHNR